MAGLEAGRTGIRLPKAPHVYALLSAVVFIIVAWAAWLMVARIEALSLLSAKQRTSHLSMMFEEHIERIFTTIDWISDAAARAWEVHQGDRHRLQQELQRIIDREPFALQVSIVDTAGLFVASNVSTVGGADLKDREHIKVQLENPIAGVYISRPLIGRISNRLSINISKRVLSDGRKWEGIVVVSFASEKLAEFFKSVEVGRDGVVALIRDDGVLLARSVNDAQVGEEYAGNEMFRTMLDRRKGTIEGAGPADGVVRYYSFRSLDALPLFVIVGVGRNEILSETEWVRRVSMVWMMGLMVALLAGGVLLSRLFHQQDSVERGRVAREKLEQTMELLRSAFAKAGVRLVVFEPPGLVLFADSHDIRSGEDPAEVNGGWVKDFVAEIAQRQVLERMQFTRTVVDEHGAKRVYSWVVVPATWVSESALVAIGFDRTDLDRREQVLHQKARLTMMGEMMTSLSHELAQPLTAINFAATTIAERSSSDDVTGTSVKLMSASVARARGIIDRLNMFGRLESASGSDVMDVSQCIDNVCVLTQNDFLLAGIRVLSSVRSELLALGDSLLFEQVLLNLLLNSRDAIVALGDAPEERRTIVIETVRAGHEAIEILVRDRGIGVPRELEARIFDPFFTTKRTGTGLGLALSFGNMRDMGGAIEFEPCDQGACFRLTLIAASGGQGLQKRASDHAISGHA